jgi:hypothetical protein
LGWIEPGKKSKFLQLRIILAKSVGIVEDGLKKLFLHGYELA